MSTDFLNRRMDLHHTSSYENHLTMDTSYPVKLAGKVMKLFTASSDFNTNKWILENSDKEVILTVESDNVYDFAGRVIKNNVGITKVYTTNKEVFKQDDYIMVIIDFDNKKMLLCSETNFKKFITGEDISSITSNVRMYTIDGDTEIPGFEHPIDTEIFDTAAEYEAETDRYALVRSDIDKVVYEAPAVNIEVDNNNKTITTRDMTPVANVDTLNINSLNVSIQNLIFPFINYWVSDYGFENISVLHSYSTINGSVNDKFIEEFCFTKEELINLPIWNSNARGYIQKEFNNIPEENKSNYYYVLYSQNYGGNHYKSAVRDDSMVFTPIFISNKKFSIFYDFNNNIVVGDKTVGLPTKGYQSNLIGNYFSTDCSNGFYVYNSQMRYDPDDSFKTILIDNLTNGNHQFPYNIFVEKNRNIANMGHSKIRQAGTDWKDSIYQSDMMKYIKRFTQFFAADGPYADHIRNRILFLTNDSVNNFPVFGKTDSKTSFYDKPPKNIILIYPEIFENVLFDKDSSGNFTHNSEDLHNFNSFYNDKISDIDFDRTKYTSGEYKLEDKDGIEHLLYELFDKNAISGYVGSSSNSNIKTQTINGYGESKLKFKCTVPTLGDDGSNQYIVDDIEGNHLMVNLITRVNVTNINHPYDTEANYNNAQFGIQDIMVVRRIKFADEHIRFENEEYKIYPDGFDSQGEPIGNGYVLYMVVNDNGSLSMIKVTQSYFKNTANIGTDVSGMMYLYYKQDTIIKRIKYFYKNNDKELGNGLIGKYDYYTTYYQDILDTSLTYDTSNYDTDMIRGFLNQYMVNNNASIESAFNNLNSYIDDVDDLSRSTSRHIILNIIKAYNLYPVVVDKPELHNICFTTIKCGTTSTRLLAFDCEKYFGGSINDKNVNNGKGFRLKNLIDDSYVYGENPLVPYVSKTKRDGQYIYNIKTYNDYIKSIPVDRVFFTEGFPYVNGVGIREDYYVGKSLYEFYIYMLTRNLAIPISDPKSLLSNTVYNNQNRLFYPKSEIKKAKDIIWITNEEGKDIPTFVDEKNNPVQIESKLSLHNNIDINSIFGLQNSYLVDSNGNDISKEYSSEDAIFVNKEQAGVKTVYSVPISDGDPYIPVLLSINGIMDDIEVDKITWESLLLALHNNKTVDILSKSLIQIKTELNNNIYLTGQNINDTISIEDNITDEDANNHDTIYDYNESDPESSEKEFKKQHYKEHNAEFDEKHNLYNFNFGYGFDSNNERNLNNRGVIVFVTDGAKTKCQTHGQVNPEGWTYDFNEGNVYPKRMFISKDGIICTKDYYDAENNNEPSSDIITIRKIDGDVSEISQYIFNKTKKQITFNKVQMSDGTEKFMYMISDEDDNHVIYINTITYKVRESADGKLIIDDTLSEDYKRKFIADGIALINGVPYVFATNGALRPGAQTVGSNTSDKLRVGNILISRKRYYYSYDNGNIVLGWVRDIATGNYFYYTLFDGKLTSQYRTLGSYDDINIEKTYWFDENGIATEVKDLLDQITELEEQDKELKEQSIYLERQMVKDLYNSNKYSRLITQECSFNSKIMEMSKTEIAKLMTDKVLYDIRIPSYNDEIKNKRYISLINLINEIHRFNSYFINNYMVWADNTDGDIVLEMLFNYNNYILNSKSISELITNIENYNNVMIDVLVNEFTDGNITSNIEGLTPLIIDDKNKTIRKYLKLVNAELINGFPDYDILLITLYYFNLNLLQDILNSHKGSDIITSFYNAMVYNNNKLKNSSYYGLPDVANIIGTYNSDMLTAMAGATFYDYPTALKSHNNSIRNSSNITDLLSNIKKYNQSLINYLKNKDVNVADLQSYIDDDCINNDTVIRLI